MHAAREPLGIRQRSPGLICPIADLKEAPVRSFAIAVGVIIACTLPLSAAETQAMRYDGPCDASAAVALDALHFVVGDDEHDTLHIFRQGEPKPVGVLDLSGFLGTGAGKESDIEGAAAIGNRIYWITSHGRNAKGKARPSRYRFFATEVLAGNPPALRPVGRPYRGLLDDMLASAQLAPYHLSIAALRAAEADGGLNIEGLAAAPDGTLLVGLRNPLPGGRALIVPLLNPARLIEDGRARFGSPVELDLGNRGIRSIERVGTGYLIVAGPTADRGRFVLYRWTGKPGEPAVADSGLELGNLRPEALFAIPGSERIQLLSDDGGIEVGGIECKALPGSRQAFRSVVLTPAP
jgi:hypothetical protein